VFFGHIWSSVRMTRLNSLCASYKYKWHPISRLVYNEKDFISAGFTGPLLHPIYNIWSVIRLVGDENIEIAVSCTVLWTVRNQLGSADVSESPPVTTQGSASASDGTNQGEFSYNIITIITHYWLRFSIPGSFLHRVSRVGLYVISVIVVSLIVITCDLIACHLISK